MSEKNLIEHLLQPGKIGTMELKNRVIYAGMTFKLADGKGRLVQSEVDSMLYRAKQEYGPGLICFPGLNMPLIDRPLFVDVNINNDENMYAMLKCTEQFKQYGVKTMAEIGVIGLRPGQPCIGASNVRYPMEFEEITRDQIKLFVEKHGELAWRAKKAGFDCLKITGVVYKKILANFMSPFTNHRTDEYGGSTENRARIFIEVLKTMRDVVGDDYPIILDAKVDELLGARGLQLEEGIELVKMMAPYLDGFTPCVGCENTTDELRAAYFTDRAYTLPQTAAVKKAVPELAIITNCKMHYPDIADAAVRDGKTDFVMLGRGLFTDPQWMTKCAHGETDKIVKCIGCLNCFTHNSRKELHPIHRACTVNPCNLREEEFYNLKPVTEPKKVLVVGGGLAGMETATIMALRGHNVTLCEKTDELGGQWIVASHGEEKVEYRTLIPDKKRALEASGAVINYNTTVDRAYLEAEKPDLVVLATGAVPKTLPYGQDMQKVNVVQGNDVLMDQAEVGDNVVIIGGRYIGIEVAVKLAKAGKKVAIVDQDDIAKGAHKYLMKYYNPKLIEYGVRLYPNCPVMDYNDNGVYMLYKDQPVTFPADTIVLAIGTTPVNDLVKDLDDLDIERVLVGDCKRIGDALYAIRDAAEAARIF